MEILGRDLTTSSVLILDVSINILSKPVWNVSHKMKRTSLQARGKGNIYFRTYLASQTLLNTSDSQIMSQS